MTPTVNTCNNETERGTGWRKTAAAMAMMVGLAQWCMLWVECHDKRRKGAIMKVMVGHRCKMGGNNHQQEHHNLANGGIFQRCNCCSQLATSMRKTEGKRWAERNEGNG
jgi:hypothetical protein